MQSVKFLLFIALVIFTNNSYAQNLADLRGESFRKSATCNIIKAAEILKLSTIPLTEKEIPEIRTLLQDTKELRTECYEQAEEIISNLLIDEEVLVNQDNVEIILQLQHEADSSFQQLLKLRKQISQQLLASILADIENDFIEPVEEAKFYTESKKTGYLITLETTLALENERRQIFVTNQYVAPTSQQQLNSILQKSHYQFTKILLLFEKWSENETNTTFFKQFNAELRYAVSILSQVLPLKNNFKPTEYKIFRDMLQKAIRLNIKMTEKENQTTAKATEIYSEISDFTAVIRNLSK